jgi:hypothetical protein
MMLHSPPTRVAERVKRSTARLMARRSTSPNGHTRATRPRSTTNRSGSCGKKRTVTPDRATSRSTDNGQPLCFCARANRALDSYAVVRPPTVRLGPKKISITRLPVTGNHFFGRETDIVFVDEAWANQRLNLVAIVAWAGVGKSTLVIHILACDAGL